eukprot:2598488-Pyramimonas_sp.AAC.1
MRGAGAADKVGLTRLPRVGPRPTRAGCTALQRARKDAKRQRAQRRVEQRRCLRPALRAPV